MVNKAIIWDFDGTLGLRPGGWSGVLASVVHKAFPDSTISADDLRPFLTSGFPWHAPENTHMQTTQEEWWEDMLPLFARAFRAVGLRGADAYDLAIKVRGEYLDLSAWQLYPDSLSTLDELSQTGWRHVLLSNHVPELPAIAAHLGLFQRFSAWFNSGQTGIEKPNPRAFRQVQDWAGPGAQLIMVGDSYTADIQGAAEMDIQGILVHKPHPLAPVYCENLKDLLNVVH